MNACVPRIIASAGILVVVALFGCGTGDDSPSSKASPESSRPPADEPAFAVHDTKVKILLVGIDGATLRLIRPFADGGLLPTFADLLERGSAAPLLSVAPMYSPALWTEIFTGRPREEHGIEYFTVAQGEGADERQRLVASHDRRTLALWNLLGPAGKRGTTIGFWATWPAEPVADVMVSDRFAHGRYVEWLDGRPTRFAVHPESLAEQLHELVVAPNDPPMEVFDRLVNWTDRERKEFLAVRRPIPNHGLSVVKFAVCAQLSYERIAFRLLAERSQPDFFGLFLIANDPICHTYFHDFDPPSYGLDVTGKSRRLGAIIPGIHRHNDAVLRRLLEAVDPETVVLLVSDHGFQPSGEPPQSIDRARFPELRQAALDQGRVTIGQTGIHEPHGLFLAAGGPIRKTELKSVEQRDVLPTILALLGMPVAEDLPGRVLTGDHRSGVPRALSRAKDRHLRGPGAAPAGPRGRGHGRGTAARTAPRPGLHQVTEPGGEGHGPRTRLPLPGAVVDYHPNWRRCEADRWFQRLMDQIDWRQDEIVLFGRPVRIPRLQAWHGVPGARYRYSGLALEPLPFTETLTEIRREVEATTGITFHAVLANLYRDGRDSMGWHSDDEPELGPQPAIASVSLGAIRRLRFRRRRPPKDTMNLELAPGSLLVMTGRTQELYHHAVPKTARAVGPRINLTFRRIQNLC